MSHFGHIFFKLAQVYVYEELKLLRKCKKKVGGEGVPIGSKVGGSG